MCFSYDFSRADGKEKHGAIKTTKLYDVNLIVIEIYMICLVWI